MIILIFIAIYSSNSLSNETGGRLGIGLLGKVSKFSNDEMWATGGVVFSKRYVIGPLITQDGEGIEFGFLYEYNQLGAIASSIHLNFGIINQAVHTEDENFAKFDGYYTMLGINYNILFIGARLLRRAIDEDLRQRRGRIVRKSADDFYIGIGIHFSP